MALILDAGALIAYERNNAKVLRLVADALNGSSTIRTTTAVVGQVWRPGGRQARLARLLKRIEEHVLDGAAARRVGVLLGIARRVDVVDGSVVDVAHDGDEVLTSDPDDIRTLAAAAGKQLAVVWV